MKALYGDVMNLNRASDGLRIVFNVVICTFNGLVDCFSGCGRSLGAYSMVCYSAANGVIGTFPDLCCFFIK